MRSSNSVAILLGLLLASGGVGAEAANAAQRGTAGDRTAMKPELWSGPATVQIQHPSDLPPEVADTRGPRGTSGEAHDDGVGYATIMAEPPEARWSNVAVGVGYAGLAPGMLVELTALDTGRTIVALVVGRETGGGLAALSPGAAQALGVGDRAPVRVRSVVTSPQDEMALRSGRTAAPRLDAPPALLTALRRKLPGRVAPQRAAAPTRTPTRSPARASAPAPAPAPVAPPAQRATGGFYVQVAALSSSARATAMARDLGGRVAAAGGLYRVQLGPFTTSAEAARARDGAARRGYADARILHSE